MRNTHIKPNDIVPVELRIECYEKAIEFIESNNSIDNDTMGLNSYDGSCLILICILWDINYFSDSPSGDTWSYTYVSNMFLEWTKNIISDIQDKERDFKRKTRVTYLKQAIEQAKLLL